MTKVSNKQIRILQIGMHDQVGGVENFLLNISIEIGFNLILLINMINYVLKKR